MNVNVQYYQGIALCLIHRKDYASKKAKRFTLNGTNQNVWIPNHYLLADGTIKPEANLAFIFQNPKNQPKLEKAGVPRVIKGT